MQTEATRTAVSAKVMELPLMKNFSESEIATNVNQFRKGEKGFYSLFKLLAFGAIGYFSWVYVLPQLFQALGQALAIIGVGVLCVALVLFAPLILKGLRSLAKGFAKKLIKNDPFAELDKQRIKMLENQKTFRISKGKILALKNDMEVEADKSEKEAKAMETKILKLQNDT